MLIEQVVRSAKPYLEGRRVKDLVVGLSLIGVALDNENIGLSYVLREALPAGCSVFPYAQQVIGKDALEIANWSIIGRDDVQRGIGMSVLTAASCGQDLPDEVKSITPFGVDVTTTDKIGMIGYISPVAKAFEEKAKDIIVFDKGISQRGGHEKVYPMEDQAKLLPTCDIVIISGTTMINGTIDSLLEMCINAREIIMVGSSCPMYPEGFTDSKLTILAGAWWNKEFKNEIFKGISSACGIRYLSNYMIKKAVHCK
ncbi:MAG: Rossmann-like domain-containing protein [Eubacteriales bacterium]